MSQYVNKFIYERNKIANKLYKLYLPFLVDKTNRIYSNNTCFLTFASCRQGLQKICQISAEYRERLMNNIIQRHLARSVFNITK